MSRDLVTPPPLCMSRNLLYLSSPQLWAQWPFLPLVRRTTPDHTEFGVLADLMGALGLPGYSSTVFFCNLFLLPERLEDLLALPKETFDATEEINAAGWTVD